MSKPIMPLRSTPLLATLLLAMLGAPGFAGARAKPKAAYKPGPMLRRFLDGPMRGVDEIIFAVRVPGRDHWYVTFGNYSDGVNKSRAFNFADGVYWGYGEGARLCRLHLRTGKLTVLLDDPKGGVRDPQMHYDGKKILFAYRKGGTHPYHLYEIGIDGSGLRQLTDGPDDDIEPTYCPDGSIVFCSSRCRRFVNCWYTRVATLYRCEADGSQVRMLSSNSDHDNTPWLLPDGRVLYMRWEYVDRSQVHFHHLWTMNPDGTGQMVFFGNLYGGISMLDAKPIPGTNRIVASFSPGHGRPEHIGHVTVVDPTLGPDVQAAARNVSKRSQWKDPYAFSESCFLVANRMGIYVMDGAGSAERVYALPPGEQRRFQCSEPRPLRPRPRERVIAPRVNLRRRTGTLFLSDIYHGRKMANVERGTIKKLLVLAQLPKPINHSGGMQPLTIGGSFTLAEVLGTVPVEPDGSATFEVPALKSVFFVALDERDMAVKRMHSFLTLQPGETMSCVGCHERRTETPRATLAASLLAMKRPSSAIQPFDGIPPVPDFPRDVQPILDRHCVRCHNPDKPDGGVDLCGDKTPMYTVSYWTMQGRNLVSDGRNRPYSNYDPYAVGTPKSRLLGFCDGSHYKAKLSPRELTTVRLWIETGACYPGTYACLGNGSYHVHWGKAGGAIRTRCGGCHTRERYDRRKRKKYKIVCFPGQRGGMGAAYNLTRPEKSRILLAPLSKKCGGYGMKGKHVFADTRDPLYQALLGSIRDARARLMAGKRFDMPGYRPTEHYIREMQRFGFLPKTLKPTDPIDVYAVDRAYWDGFDYRPPVGPRVSAR